MFTTRPEIRGTFGVVASTHWLASAAGMGILERGGNAFDAAVAAGFVLQVVEPHMNGPGGDLPILLWDGRNGGAEAIYGQGCAPAAATIVAFRDLGLDLVPGTGSLAACVPGAFGAWLTLLRDHGTMALPDVLEPAIGYAERGYPVVPQITSTIAEVQPLFETEWTSSAAVYLPGGAPPVPGRLFRNPALATTYRRLTAAAEAARGDRETRIEAALDAWYRGFVAEAIGRFCHDQAVMDATGRRHRGLITAADMASWRPQVGAPLRYDYHGFTVLKCGPVTQGPVFLQQLSLLDGFDLASLDPYGAEFVHLCTEAAKLAFADREAWYGDPDFVEVPIADLLAPAYVAARRRLIGDRASLDLRPGSPGGRQPRLPAWVRMEQPLVGVAGVGEPTAARGAGGSTPERAAGAPSASAQPARGDTCHVDVIDRWGNMVAATPSGGWLQSNPIIPELGFCLGSRMQMFWLEEGLASSLAPGKRPRTTLTPSLALKEGEPYLAFGTPGGDQQDQWSLLLFLRHVHHGLNLQEAIDAPAFHTEHAPSSFWPRQARPGSLAVEGRFEPAVVASLRERGHAVEVAGDWSEGRLCACAREPTPDGTVLKAAANPRGMQGYAVGR